MEAIGAAIVLALMVAVVGLVGYGTRRAWLRHRDKLPGRWRLIEKTEFGQVQYWAQKSIYEQLNLGISVDVRSDDFTEAVFVARAEADQRVKALNTKP